MSHAAEWRCHSCSLPLGQIRGGTLYPLVPVVLIDARGEARLRCPECGTARCWFPAGAAAIMAGEDRVKVAADSPCV